LPSRAAGKEIDLDVFKSQPGVNVGIVSCHACHHAEPRSARSASFSALQRVMGTMDSSPRFSSVSVGKMLCR
jgi:hypothetical protein